MNAEFAVEASSSKRSRRKRTRKGKKNMTDDLISNLPDHIIHHILSFLRCKKDVDRISVLSKRWRDIMGSFMILDFDQRIFDINKSRNGMFINHVNSTLKNRIEQGGSIRKFALRITSCDSEMSTHVNRWIRWVTESNVQELDLCFPNKTRLYRLSKNVFTVEKLTSLRVSGCNLTNCKVINLPNLRKLCLEKLHVHEKMLEGLVSGCPLIDDLRLIQCSTEFRRLVLSSSKLSRVDLHFCRGLQKVELQTPNLEKFWYHQLKFVRKDNCDLDLASCGVLKSLTIEIPAMTEDKFQNLVSKLPVLEQLSLCKCNKLKSITVSSHRLKKLVLRDCKKLREADIDSPNLTSFEYKGKDMPFLSMDPSGLKEANLYLERGVKNQTRTGFCYDEDDKARFAKLREFLEKFDHSLGLKLLVHSKKTVMVHEDMSKILLPPIYDVELEIVKPSLGLEDLVDNVLRKWRPVSLFIVSPTITDLSERLHRKLANMKKPVCCSFNIPSNKCWRHSLKSAKSTNVAADNSNQSDWFTWLKRLHSSDVHKITAFTLTWVAPERPNAAVATDVPEHNRGRSSKIVLQAGPWGGNGGSNWDDGAHRGVKEIKLVYDRCVDSIRFVYDKKGGKTVVGERHGGLGGTKTAEIKLQYPDEYLTQIHGYYHPVVHGGHPVIRSLTFTTNKRRFGPFGVEEGTPFTQNLEGVSVVGFNGRGGWYLDSIGVHYVEGNKSTGKTIFSKLKRRISSVARPPNDAKTAY
ncbi:Jacalin-related lectin 19 [Linum grandiflorum]